MRRYHLTGSLIIALLVACTPAQDTTPSPLPKSTLTNLRDDPPFFPGAIQTEAEIGNYHFVVENADIEAVKQFYENQMPIAGWELLYITDMSGTDIGRAYALSFVKDHEIATIDIFTRDNITHVVIHLE